jgi:hypothetical protein
VLEKEQDVMFVNKPTAVNTANSDGVIEVLRVRYRAGALVWRNIRALFKEEADVPTAIKSASTEPSKAPSCALSLPIAARK